MILPLDGSHSFGFPAPSPWPGGGSGRWGSICTLIILSLFAVEPLSFDTMIAAFHGDFHRDRPET